MGFSGEFIINLQQGFIPNLSALPAPLRALWPELAVQKRAEAKDYLDLDALLRQGIDLPTVLAAGIIVYGCQFNPLITLKALSYFDDLPALPVEVRERLSNAIRAVDVTRLPTVTPYVKRPGEME